MEERVQRGHSPIQFTHIRDGLSMVTRAEGVLLEQARQYRSLGPKRERRFFQRKGSWIHYAYVLHMYVTQALGSTVKNAGSYTTEGW